MPIQKVLDIVGYDRKTVLNIRKVAKERGTIKRKEGSGGQNRERDAAFMEALEGKIKEVPTMSMRRLTKEINVAKVTIWRAMKDLELILYVCR